jgi:hypothetical protein
MRPEPTIVDIILERQKAMRREMDRRGILLKVAAHDSGLNYDTLLTYFPANRDAKPAQIPASAIYALTGHVPDDIVSLLLPAGHLIVRAPEEVDHDEIAGAVHDYLLTKEKAHHPESPAGRDIAPCEDATLRTKLAVVRGGRS